MEQLANELNEKSSQNFRNAVRNFAALEFPTNSVYYCMINLVALMKELMTEYHITPFNLAVIINHVMNLATYTQEEKDAIQKIIQDAINGAADENQKG